MKIATVSLDQIWEDKEANLMLCEEYIKVASGESVDLVIFPEMTLTGFSTNITQIAESDSSSETIEKFRSLVLRYSIAIIFGVVIKDGDKALNRLVFIDKNGIILAKYSKIHPFSFSGEDRYFNAGDRLETVEFLGAKIGFTICYDLRFPELYTALAKECDIIVNIANWPSKRVEHWNTLLKARAIENQLFIVGVNRTGKDANNLEYVESSRVLNANGESLEAKSIKNMKIFDINTSWTKEFKNNFNTTRDRKIEFYRGVI